LTHLQKNKMNKGERLIVLIVFFLNLLLGLYPLWQGGSVWLRFKELSDFEAAYYTPVVYAEFILSILLIFLSKSVRLKDYTLLFVFTFFFILSVAFNGFKSSVFTIVAMPAVYILVIQSFKGNVHNIGYIVYLILLVWIIMPIIECHFFSSYSRQVLFYGFTEETGFHGYAYHKNTYAYIVGLCILITYFIKIPILLKYLLYIPLLAALLYSECRSVLLAVVFLFLMSLYYKFGINKRSLFIKCLLFVAVTIPMGVILVRHSFFEDPARGYILTKFISVIENNFLWGTGTSTVVEPLGENTPNPAHNFIIQGWADRGVFTIFFFLLFLFQLIKKNNPIVKTFITYMMIVGLFQPYLNIAIPSYLMMLSLLTPFVISGSSNYLNYGQRVH